MTPNHFHNQNKNGIYLFASAHCRKCSEQKEMMKNVKYQIVECDDDPEFIYKNYNVDLIPCVRVYKDGIVVYEKIMVMTKEEIEQLKNYE
jgi:glutaredoxin-related protein